MSNVHFISELYYPEETSTGYFVTGTAEGIANVEPKRCSVSVLCSQPTYSKRGIVAEKLETWNNVKIRRLSAPIGDKNRISGRLWNMLSLTLRMAFVMLLRIRRGDLVFAVTNPPSLPILTGWICKLKGSRAVLMVQDVYPDVLLPAGILSERSLLYRGANVLQRHMLRCMNRVIVLGRDMEKRITLKLEENTDKISIIPNWGDVDTIQPELRIGNPVRKQHGLEDKFIIQLSGNLGRTHGLVDLIELMKQFRENDTVHFLVFGWGAGKSWLEDQIKENDLTNITLLSPCAMEELGIYLTACDLFFLPFKKGMEGVSVPSRMYNVMAAGNAILAVTSSHSELALVVKEEGIGYVKDPGDIQGMVEAVREAMENQQQLQDMRIRSRVAVEEKYTRETVVAAYHDLVEEFSTS